MAESQEYILNNEQWKSKCKSWMMNDRKPSLYVEWQITESQVYTSNDKRHIEWWMRKADFIHQMTNIKKDKSMLKMNGKRLSIYVEQH